jgi:hypothetical protein
MGREERIPGGGLSNEYSFEPVSESRDARLPAVEHRPARRKA